MTIGDRIKYFRKKRGITQNQLAELTGIHPVSIRKYETNKMQPQTPQLERIAAALEISYSAIYGHDPAVLRIQTRGDLMGLLMAALKSGLIRIEGERNPDQMIIEDTCRIMINSVLLPYFCRIDKTNNKEVNLDEDGLKIRDRAILNALLKWERLYQGYMKYKKQLEKEPNDIIQTATEELGETLEQIEMEYQSSQILLDQSDGIKVKIDPSWE